MAARLATACWHHGRRLKQAELGPPALANSRWYVAAAEVTAAAVGPQMSMVIAMVSMSILLTPVCTRTSVMCLPARPNRLPVGKPAGMASCSQCRPAMGGVDAAWWPPG